VTDLLERGAEVDVLAGSLEHAAAGSGRLVLVEGAAGIGKTRLLEACAQRAAEDGIQVLWSRADQVLMESSFAVVRELLWPLVRGSSKELFVGAAALAAPVFEDASAEATDLDRHASVMHGLYWLVADIAEVRPLLLCVDDAHWMDAASRRFLAYLGRRLGSLPVLAVAARRSGERSEQGELSEIAELVLRPGPLSEQATETLVRARLGARADHELSASCHQATGGNPFYLGELLDALAAEPDRPSAAVAVRVRSLGTGAIARTVLVRLARLGEDCERMAQAMSVLAPGSPLRHAASLAALDRDRAVRAADLLRAADIFAAGPELSFAHPIVRESVGAELPPSRRAALHTAAARQLLAEGAAADQVAAHLLSAEPYAETWVVDALRAAARRALGQGSPEVAVSYLRRALAEPPEPGSRLAVLLELGIAETRLPMAHDYTALREALELATQPEQRAEIALRLALALFGVIRSDAGRAALEQVLDCDQGLPVDVAEELEQTLIGGGIVDLNGASSVLARAQRHFERARRGEISDPRMLTALAMAGAVAGSAASELAALSRQALADERLFTEWLDDGYVSATVALTWTDQLEESARAQDAGIEQAQLSGWAAMYMQLAVLRSDTALRAGDLRLAEEHGQRAYELALELGAVPFAAIPLAAVLLEGGRAAPALELLESVSLSESEAMTWPGVALLALRGRAHILAGALERGVGELLDAERPMAEAGLQLSVIVDWAAAASWALAELGRREEALAVAERELVAASAFGAARRRGMALSARGLLDPGEDGLARLLEAVEVLEASPARLEHARALVNLGGRLRERGERDPARRALSLGLDIAYRCGAGGLSDRARAELIATGLRPRRAALSGADALTPAESRSARMAAEGLTNREIAQALFLSAKTVEKHLSQAYLKLKIQGRGELARALDQQNLGVSSAKE
jgi:DNA-binding CsgD family transcriptional regulator